MQVEEVVVQIILLLALEVQAVAVLVVQATQMLMVYLAPLTEVVEAAVLVVTLLVVQAAQVSSSFAILVLMLQLVVL